MHIYVDVGLGPLYESVSQSHLLAPFIVQISLRQLVLRTEKCSDSKFQIEGNSFWERTFYFFAMFFFQNISTLISEDKIHQTKSKLWVLRKQASKTGFFLIVHRTQVTLNSTSRELHT